MATYFLKPKDQDRLGFTKLKINRERLPNGRGTRYDVSFFKGRKPALFLGVLTVSKVKDGIGGRNWDVLVNPGSQNKFQFEITRSKTRREALNKAQRDLRFELKSEYGLKLPIRL